MSALPSPSHFFLWEGTGGGAGSSLVGTFSSRHRTNSNKPPAMAPMLTRVSGAVAAGPLGVGRQGRCAGRPADLGHRVHHCHQGLSCEHPSGKKICRGNTTRFAVVSSNLSKFLRKEKFSVLKFHLRCHRFRATFAQLNPLFFFLPGAMTFFYLVRL